MSYTFEICSETKLFSTGVEKEPSYFQLYQNTRFDHKITRTNQFAVKLLFLDIHYDKVNIAYLHIAKW